MKSITACPNTNTLVWAKSFQSALKRFAGHGNVGWFGAKMPLSEVLGEALGGGSDERVEVRKDLFRFKAFRPDSATERGAVFIGAKGTIRAAGVMHFNCVQSCSKSYHLAIIVPERDEQLEGLVQSWAEEETRENAQQGLEEGLTTIAVTDVVIPKK